LAWRRNSARGRAFDAAAQKTSQKVTFDFTEPSPRPNQFDSFDLDAPLVRNFRGDFSEREEINSITKFLPIA